MSFDPTEVDRVDPWKPRPECSSAPDWWERESAPYSAIADWLKAQQIANAASTAAEKVARGEAA